MRHILIIRHGIAEDASLAARRGLADEHRALTDKGQRRFAEAAQGLRRVCPQLDHLLSSPLLRAWQTAEILADVYEHQAIDKQTVLAPGGTPEQYQDLLNRYAGDTTIALVGHEPELGEWIGWALAGRARAICEVKKGSATLLAFADDVDAGAGELVWLLTPRLLRNIAGNASED